MKTIINLGEKLVNTIYNLPKRTKNILVVLLSVLLALSIYFFPETLFPHLRKELPTTREARVAFYMLFIYIILYIPLSIPLTIVLWKFVNNEYINIGFVLSNSLKKSIPYIIVLTIFAFLYIGLKNLLVIPGILFSIYTGFAPIIILVDTPNKRKIRESFKRSINLVKYNFSFVLILSVFSSIVFPIDILLGKFLNYSAFYFIFESIISLAFLLIFIIAYKLLVQIAEQKKDELV